MSDSGSVLSASRPVVDRRSRERLDARRFETLAQALVHHARHNPYRPAVVTGDGHVTAAQLAVRARDLASVIDQRSDPARHPVAIEMDESIESVIAAVAVLISSRPLVPVDTGQPAARRDLILELTQASLVDHRALLADPPSTAEHPPGEEPGAADDIALILMTSGSTGSPKGVQLSGRACLGKAYDVIGPLVLSPTDRLGNTLPLGFGAGINTLLAGLLGGIPVLCRDPRSTDPVGLRQWLWEKGATTLHCSVPLARGLASAGRRAGGGTETLPDLRAVVSYGESLEGADLRAIRERLAPRAQFVNWYAATECGVVAFGSIPPATDVPDGRLPVGRAVRERRVMVVDDAGCPLDPGQVGEIWLCGGDFASGYLGDMRMPVHRDDDGIRWYRTGDRGRVDEYGALHVVGRGDAAVKIRGYLVEPGEVASALRRLPGVTDAIVHGVERDGRTDLVAHIATDPTAPTPTVRSVRIGLRESLPDWMVPRFVETYDRLPRTDRGKIDRSALRAPGEPDNTRAATRERLSSAMDFTQLGVADVVGAVLGRADVEPDDDLIDLGADSLALTSILSGIAARFHVHVDVARVVDDPTVSTLAAVVRDEVEADAHSRRHNPVLVPLRAGGDRTPLVVVAGAGAPAVSLVPLTRHLAPGRPVLGMQAWGLENRGLPDRSVRKAARRNIAALQNTQPVGPYLLAGHSMGALIAWEMAAQLRDAGHVVEMVVLIDPHLSEPMLKQLGPAGEPVGEAVPAAAGALYSGRPLNVGVLRLVGLRLKMVVAGPIRFDPVTQWLLFYNRGMTTLRRHRPRPLDTPAAVLRTTENPQHRAHWSRLARGPLRVDEVSGGHVDVLHEPFVAAVAAAIDAAITDVGSPT